MFSLPKDKENLAHLWWLPSAEAIIFVIVFYLSLYVMPYLINSDGDLGRHIELISFRIPCLVKSLFCMSG